MVLMPVAWGCGQLRWRSRLTCHRVYLRFTTRGFARGRRFGRSLRASSLIAWRQSREMTFSRSGY